MRLIDANKVDPSEVFCGSSNLETSVRMGVDILLSYQPTIDPETLPIVRELREKLTRYEKEVEILKSSAGINCLSCEYMHKNGNCTAVGGFCTAVPAAYCKLIPELREKLARYERLEEEGRIKILPKSKKGTCGRCRHFHRFPGTQRGTCDIKELRVDRWGNPHKGRGRFEPAQSKLACKKYEEQE